MPASRLIRPSETYRQSFLDALEEYHAEERYLYHDSAWIKPRFKTFVQTLRTDGSSFRTDIEDWVEWVPETVLWLVKDSAYLGTVEIRHRLNWHLEKWGGHLHFIIRPSMRGKGFGRKILQKALPFADYLGIDKALITVDPKNIVARHIIESCGGVLEDETPETGQFPARARYWIPCG